MGISIGELFVSLGFDVDDDKLKTFNDRIRDARNDVLKLTGAAAAAVGAIAGLITGPIEKASTFKQFQDQFGYSAEGLQKWARVASMVNNTLTFDAAIGKYKAFAEYVQKAQFGGGAQALAALGADVQAGKTPEQYLEELSGAAKSGIWQQRFGANWRSAVSQYLGQTGLGTDYLDALMTTASQRDTMTKGYIQTPGQIEQLDEINGRVKELGRQYELFAQKVTIQYGPKILEWLNKFLEALPGLIKAFFDVAHEVEHIVTALGGFKTAGELILAYFATTWTVGMLATISTVGTKIAGMMGAGAAAQTAAAAGGASVIGGIATTIGVQLGALGLGFLGGQALMDKTGWGQKIADWLVPEGSGHYTPVEHMLTAPPAGAPAAAAAQAPAPIEHMLTQDVKVTVTAHGNTDPQQLAAEVVREFQARTDRNMVQTLQQLNLGSVR